MVQLWTDYNADLPALTGQTATRIPMLVSQQHSVPSGAGQTSVRRRWRSGRSASTTRATSSASGPKYQYAYVSTPRRRPPDALDYERLGEKYGQVYYERVVLGRDWQPLQPIERQRAGNVITVRFHVPVPPLAWDDTLPVAAPDRARVGEGARLRGAARATCRPPSTRSRSSTDDTVKITCRSDVSGLAVTVGYAFTTEGVAMTVAAKRGTFRWGHLRDSDPFVGATTQMPQQNWAVSFLMAVQ